MISLASCCRPYSTCYTDVSSSLSLQAKEQWFVPESSTQPHGGTSLSIGRSQRSSNGQVYRPLPRAGLLTALHKNARAQEESLSLTNHTISVKLSRNICELCREPELTPKLSARIASCGLPSHEIGRTRLPAKADENDRRCEHVHSQPYSFVLVNAKLTKNGMPELLVHRDTLRDLSLLVVT